eukprot:COSAG05_NODE_4687_length_1408_cov_8.233002_3_plen_179_part_01
MSHSRPRSRDSSRISVAPAGEAGVRCHGEPRAPRAALPELGDFTALAPKGRVRFPFRPILATDARVDSSFQEGLPIRPRDNGLTSLEIQIVGWRWQALPTESDLKRRNGTILVSSPIAEAAILPDELAIGRKCLRAILESNHDTSRIDRDGQLLGERPRYFPDSFLNQMDIVESHLSA